MTNYVVIGSVYECKVNNNLNITSPTDVVIEEVTGTHMSGKTNNDVIVFTIDSKTVKYFPKELEKFFKNLKSVRILNSYLKQISQFDIQSISNLMYLNFDNNEFEILEDGLFDYHPNMQVILFNSNKIFHVGKNVFNNMKNISYLNFASNPCIDMYSDNNLSGAQVIIESLKSKCFDAIFANFTQSLSNLEVESKTLTFETFPDWKENLEVLEAEFKNSTFSYLFSIQTRFEVLNEIKIDDFTTQNPVTTSTTALSVTTTTARPDDCNFDDLENNLSELFTKSLNQTEHNLKNSFAESCTDVNYQTLYLMKDEFTKINEKLVEHSSEVRTEMIKNDVQHSSILSDISNLKEKMEILEGKLDKILTAINGG